MATNPIEQILERESKVESPEKSLGRVEEILSNYSVLSNSRLLGFLLEMSYDEIKIVTCDAWKRKCGGVPKNSFVLVKLGEEAAGAQKEGSKFLILARITETATTPVASDIQETIFQIHKVQAKVDPFTNADLQWGALKAKILGTYYDKESENNRIGIECGNDVDNFLSPHFYEIYVPRDEHLEVLINSFVQAGDPINIGRLRYTETETVSKGLINVKVSPQDFIANRTALFGKTRTGKSNTIKVILDTMLDRMENLGQVVFDLSGEYTYPDPQTGASIYLRHKDKCVRYSLKPREVEAEKKAKVAAPKMLRCNFYSQIELGHAIIVSLFDVFHARRPDYIAPLLAWEPVDESEIQSRYPDFGDQTRYKRALSMYKALLYEAGFSSGRSMQVELEVSKAIRQALSNNVAVRGFAKMERGNNEISKRQDLSIAARIYEYLWEEYRNQPNDPNLFPVRNGKKYFDPIHECILRMLGDRNISGAKKLTPFKDYHHERGSDVVKEIVAEVDQGETVLVDLANADPVVAGYYTEILARAILSKQMGKFSTLDPSEFDKHSVLFYFEEAHNLFRADDKDLSSVYNKLAKEGAKFRIGMVYATQSMTTLSPDLLKNTENFFIAHLNDDREIKEVERRYEFDGIGLDVQRARSKGYVRMITLSHRYALPVQIKLFQLGQ